MTPLAQEIMRRHLTQRPGPVNFTGNPAEMFNHVHFFEVSAVLGMVDDLTASKRHTLPEDLSFLPFPETWIEYQDPGKAGWTGCLLQESPCETYARVELFTRVKGGPIVYRGWAMNLPLKGHELRTERAILTPKARSAVDREEIGKLGWGLYGLLAIINTPRLIGRKSHQPDRILARKLLSHTKLPEMHPLRGWTEILLRAEPTREADGVVQRSGLTGEKCRHWVKSHIGIRWGQLVIIKAHERGNEALGFRPSRYRVAA